MQLPENMIMYLRGFQTLCGETAASKGFHDDRNKIGDGPELTNWQGNKLLLIVSEIVEAHDEIRKGNAADETYYPTRLSYGVEGPHKPEGVPSEIADAVIRCFDFAYTEGIDLAGIIAEKLSYNASRERLHGKAF